LRVYSEYRGLLSRSAWELLGSPECVAVEVDEIGYSIVPAVRSDRTAIRVYRGRNLSLGVISSALRGSVFPLRISLVPEQGRLRFGNVA
jgi:hypothetical protein